MTHGHHRPGHDKGAAHLGHLCLEVADPPFHPPRCLLAHVDPFVVVDRNVSTPSDIGTAMRCLTAIAAVMMALAGCSGSSDSADGGTSAATSTTVAVADLEVAVAMSNPPGATDGIFFQRPEVGAACGPVQEGSVLYDARDEYVGLSPAAQVVLRDEVDKIVGTGSLGPGEVATMGDDGWSCVWRATVNDAADSERYQVEVAGIDLGIGTLTGDTLRVDLP